MKKFLPLMMLLMTASAANAGGLVHKMSSSVRLTVDAAHSTVNRVGSQYSISGSNVNTTDGNTAQTVSQGTITSGILNPGNIQAEIHSAGEQFSFSTSYVQGDALSTAAPTVGNVPNYSSITSYTAGTAGDLAGTVTTAGDITITAGGPGSTGVAQFVSEITVID